MGLYIQEDRMATQEETDAIVRLLNVSNPEVRTENLAYHVLGRFEDPPSRGGWYLIEVSPIEELYGSDRFESGDAVKFIVIGSTSSAFAGRLLVAGELFKFLKDYDGGVKTVKSWGVSVGYGRKSGSKYWTKQWNPIVGCRKCSSGCRNCYVEAWARRFNKPFSPHTTGRPMPTRGTVFCGNMTDLFAEFVADPLIYVSIANAFTRSKGDSIDARYLWLTKRADRMANLLSALTTSAEYDSTSMFNQYFGFTAEGQTTYDLRSEQFSAFPRSMKWWISAEPLLAPIDFRFLGNDEVTGERCIFGHRVPSFVTVGCESGPGRRPCRIEWVESIVEQCREAGTLCFVKQLDIDGKCVTDMKKFPEHLRVRQLPWTVNK